MIDVDLLDMQFEEDDEQLPTGFLAKKASSQQILDQIASDEIRESL